MARILGLDLGSYSVKGALIESTMRGHAFRGWGEAKRVQEGDPAETLKAALTELLAAHPFHPDQVVVALPGPSLATHVLQLPFTDTKRLEATLPFELEGQLPFDIDEAQYDYQIAAQSEKKSDLWVSVVRKTELRELLQLLASLKLDPKIVTHPAAAYQNLILSTQVLGDAAGGQRVAVIDLGHERTSVAVGQLGRGLEFARTFGQGGKQLTLALAQEFGVSFAQASEWKDAYGALGNAASGKDGERAAAVFARALGPIQREVRQTLKAFTARTHLDISQLYLCGGTSRLTGLDEHLARELGLPAENIKLPLEAASVVPPASHAASPQAYALSLRGQATGQRSPRLNFRRGDFSFKGSFDYVRVRAVRLGVFAACLLCLFIVHGIVRNTLLARRERQVDQILCDITQRILGQCEKNYERAVNMLKGKESPAAVIPKLSAVSVLTEITQRLPPDVPITLEQLVIDPSRVTAKVQTDSSKEIDKITSALKTYPCFTEVREGKVEKSKDGAHVNFRLDVQVECPEKSQPPQG